MLPVCRNHPDVSEGVRHCVRCANLFCGDCLVDIEGLPHCAACKQEQLLDVRSGVDRTTLNLAGLGKRFLAIFVDGIIQAIPIYGLMFGVIFAMAKPGKEPSAWLLLIYIPMFVIPFLYEALMLQWKDGQTVGKMALKVRVVRADGSRITSGQAWGRAAIRLVLNCFWIVDYVPAFFTKEKTTLHDLAAGTRVVEIY
ncbi:MAG TPA: RDD family protein [Thermoanaerobaculia bacterium]|nr:RDD family protein [Thermoanaerobaculia bacterium]